MVVDDTETHFLFKQRPCKGYNLQSSYNQRNISKLSPRTTTTMSTSSNNEGTMHDLLSIGEIQSALSHQYKQGEIDRLPLFLRLLATAQPLSAVPHLLPNSDPPPGSKDPLVNAVVAKLENVAAKHSEAESIDLLTGHIAPTITRRISKMSRLKRLRNSNEWNTTELTATALAPLSTFRMKKARTSMNHASAASYSGESDDNLESADEQDETEGVKPDTGDLRARLTRMRSEGRESLIGNLAEDSQEAHLTRLWSEVASLVVDSLQPVETNKDDEEASPDHTLQVKADSLLAESDATLGGVEACLAALMHHAPVLRHDHVASAFCRASVPQAAALIHRMGANSPNAVTCLVRGCMTAVEIDGDTDAVVATAKAAVRELAKLSSKEAARIRGMLGKSMMDVQLELALQHDHVAAACLLTRHLSSPDSRLRNLLPSNTALVSKTYACLTLRIEGLERTSGELKLFLRSLAWLLVAVNSAKCDSLVTTASILGSKLTWLCGDSNDETPERSDKDDFIGILLTSSMVLCSLLALSCGDNETEDAARKQAWQGLLKTVLTINPPSTRSAVFQSRVAAMLHSQMLSGLQDLVKETISTTKTDSDCLDEAVLHDGFTKLCKWAIIYGDLDTLRNKTLTAGAVVLDPCALIQLIVASNIEVSKLESLLRDILKDPIAANKLVYHPCVCELLAESIAFLSKDDRMAIPLISQVTRETLTRKCIQESEEQGDKVRRGQMSLGFAYTVLFFDQNPDSPFAFDPRDEPVVEILHIMKKDELDDVCSLVESVLSRHAPEIIYESNSLNTAKTTLLEISNESELKHGDILKLLSDAIRNMLGSPEIDPSGVKVERTFLLAQRHIPYSQVDCQVVSALTALPNSPAPYYSYSMLYRDPLVLLQCPLRVWRCQGLRRVALSVLGRLIPANENLARQKSPSEDVAEELISSRNVVLLRCLLSLASGCNLSSDDAESPNKPGSPPCNCHVLTGMIRSLVANNTGLVATLVKHGLPNETVDWLVGFVPECSNDAGALLALLSSDRLTAAERLKTADAALRIVIALGRDENEAKSIASACLQHLVSSFYLVLGPVGVPVNALIVQDSDHGNNMDNNLTQVCRQGTFRILSALQNVRGSSRPLLKNECSMALQKLASLCKGESGAAGAGANRRKALLKEIWDAIVKALNAMGSGVSLS